MSQYARKDYIFDPGEYRRGGNLDREKLLRDAKKVAKATNQRLVRLEKAGYTNAPVYRGAIRATSGQYNKTDSVAWGHVDKSGRPRYKERVDKLSNKELMDMLYAMSKTQTGKSSTVGGVRKQYREATQRIAEAMGDTDLTENDVMKALSNEALKDYVKQYGYRAILTAIGGLKDADSKHPEKDLIELLAKKGSLAEVMKEIDSMQKEDAEITDDWIRAN